MPDSQEHDFDDIFLCIGDTFIVAAACYALQRQETGLPYKFAVVVSKNRNGPYERLVARLGGVVIDDAALAKARVSCARALIHSFGRLDWQLAKLEKIDRAKTGVYADSLKNEYNVETLKKVGASSIIFFGWVYIKSQTVELPEIEVIRLSHCFKPYEMLKSEFAVPELTLRPELTRENSALVFLRYWGVGVYKLSEGVTLGDAVCKGIAEDKSVTLYVKGDPRIPKVHYDSVKPRLQEAGYTVKPLYDIFVGADEAPKLDEIPAEVLLHGIAGAGFRCYVYDSSICFPLQMRAGAKVIFPTKEQTEGLFANDAGEKTVLTFARRYERICNLIAKDGVEDAVHEIGP